MFVFLPRSLSILHNIIDMSRKTQVLKVCSVKVYADETDTCPTFWKSLGVCVYPSNCRRRQGGGVMRRCRIMRKTRHKITIVWLALKPQ